MEASFAQRQQLLATIISSDQTPPFHWKQAPTMASGKILVAQCGGPTAVINQSLVGVALEARRFHNIARVYGARHGVRGIVSEDFVHLTQ